jgi:hypothetical protein
MPAPDYAVEIAALEGALAKGELTVETLDERVTYRSTADLGAALAYFRTQARAAGPASRRSATTLAAFEAD